MNYIELKGDILKKLHKTQVEILDEIVRICKKNNIQYMLTGGTLLGAVRHKGFIPWDDDLDIIMLREDYEKFLNVCGSDLSDKYVLDCEKTNVKYWLTFAKIRKRNTVFRESALENLDMFKGIYVDIFVLDNIKAEKSFMQKLQIIIIKSNIDALFFKLKINQDIKKCRRPVLTKMLSFLSISKLHKINKKLCMKYDNNETKYITNFASPYNYKKEVLLKEEFFPLTQVEFEGKKYNAPKNYDYYLKKIYGDYMKLPPKEKRVNHGCLEVNFNTNK